MERINAQSNSSSNFYISEIIKASLADRRPKPSAVQKKFSIMPRIKVIQVYNGSNYIPAPKKMKK